MKDLYLLVDGTHADPDDCDVGADLELRHANGLAVALNEDGSPMTVAQGAIDNMNAQAAAEVEPDAPPHAEDAHLIAGDDPEPEPEPAKAEPKKGPAKAKKTPAKNREIRTR